MIREELLRLGKMSAPERRVGVLFLATALAWITRGWLTKIEIGGVSPFAGVSDAGIVHGMELVWQYTKMIIEPSSATVIAAIKEHPDMFAGKRVGIILSGSNIDRDLFPQLMHVRATGAQLD